MRVNRNRTETLLACTVERGLPEDPVSGETLMLDSLVDNAAHLA